jgi:hypothetical protein
MKTIIVSLSGLAALVPPSCTTVKECDPSTHTY